MSTLTDFLNIRQIHVTEGYCQLNPQQVLDLIELSKKPNINVMEIGFNAGHSAEIFLKNNKDLTLTSFDLGQHVYVSAGKEYIDTTFPTRHTLILGDSRITVPHYHAQNPTTKFDFIFIDGGHEYDIAKTDMQNCVYLAHPDTIVALDDTVLTLDWEMCYTVGPTRTWQEHLQNKKIEEIKRIDYGPGLGMSWGKYIFDSTN